MTFGAWLLRELARHDMTQSDLARRVGVRTGTVSKWVRATNPTDPSPTIIVRLANVLGIPPADVLLAVVQEEVREEGATVVPGLPPRMHAGEVELVARLAWAVRQWRDAQAAADESPRTDEESQARV